MYLNNTQSRYYFREHKHRFNGFKIAIWTFSPSYKHTFQGIEGNSSSPYIKKQIK